MSTRTIVSLLTGAALSLSLGTSMLGCRCSDEPKTLGEELEDAADEVGDELEEAGEEIEDEIDDHTDDKK